MVKINAAGLCSDRRRRLYFPPTYRTENKEMNECWIFGPDSLTSQDFYARELFSLFSLRENFHENNRLAPRAFYANEHQQRAAEDIRWFFARTHIEPSLVKSFFECYTMLEAIELLYDNYRNKVSWNQIYCCKWILVIEFLIWKAIKFNLILVWIQKV